MANMSLPLYFMYSSWIGSVYQKINENINEKIAGLGDGATLLREWLKSTLVPVGPMILPNPSLNLVKHYPVLAQFYTTQVQFYMLLVNNMVPDFNYGSVVVGIDIMGSKRKRMGPWLPLSVLLLSELPGYLCRFYCCPQDRAELTKLLNKELSGFKSFQQSLSDDDVVNILMESWRFWQDGWRSHWTWGLPDGVFSPHGTCSIGEQLAPSIEEGGQTWESIAQQYSLPDYIGGHDYSANWVPPDLVRSYGLEPPVGMSEIGFRWYVARLICQLGYTILCKELPLAVDKISIGWRTVQ